MRNISLVPMRRYLAGLALDYELLLRGRSPGTPPDQLIGSILAYAPIDWIDLGDR